MSVVERMQAQVRRWEEAHDHRAVFLGCYSMMTQNMLVALDEGAFQDPGWVNRLLHHFADYYFEALEAYEQNPLTAPAVWQIAHDGGQSPNLKALQKLLLGVNAHINYDLVFAVSDLLQDEWAFLSPGQRQMRYADHCKVNVIIAQTIDAVQDQVIERYDPKMDTVDRLMGSLDEWLVSRLITGWRDRVWRNALDRVAASQATRVLLAQQVEEACLKVADSILFRP
ncbi:DUF5995 family protein [Meiothermus cerbereus]|uniref:DUF5995 family protein n=1 Tax=Meiothermus cerbereus TaxID=65552 RepID=UPI003EEAD3FA